MLGVPTQNNMRGTDESTNPFRMKLTGSDRKEGAEFIHLACATPNRDDQNGPIALVSNVSLGDRRGH